MSPLLRHQLTTWSPLGLTNILSGVVGALDFRDESREELRALLREEFRADDVLLVDSGTHALQLVLGHTSAQAGNSPIALPAFNCFDLATAAIGAGTKVLPYDVDPETLGPDPESFEQCLRNGARVAVVASLYGIPPDWRTLQGIADRHGALLVEDAAQGLGGSLDDRPLGSLGRISILSFARGKGWTGGRGGAVLVRDGQRLPEFPSLPSAEVSNLLSLGAQWSLGRPALYGLPRGVRWLGLGETHYRDPSPVSAMPRSAARTLLASRHAAQVEMERRRAHARELAEQLVDHVSLPRIFPGGKAGYLRLPVRVPGGMRSLAESGVAVALGVAQSFPIPLPELEQLRRNIVSPRGKYPGARVLASDLLTIPTHSRLSAVERERIVGLFNGSAR